MFDRFFKISERGSTPKREAVAGVTTFMTMAYIIFVNPSLLSSPAGANMDFDAVMVATCLASAFATILMGVIANYPIALAPGMGLNVLFSFGICAAMGVPWPQALGMVFWAGVIFTLLTLLRIREMIVDAVPDCLKFGAAAGIGAFIAFMGLKDAGIIAANESTFVTLGDLHARPTLLALGGLFFTAGLMARKVRGAILWGILATGLAGVLVDRCGVDSWKSDGNEHGNLLCRERGRGRRRRADRLRQYCDRGDVYSSHLLLSGREDVWRRMRRPWKRGGAPAPGDRAGPDCRW
jgi:AGZA family xanthine/uracil permease-like MFS transporter